ncbi:16S rRNA (guanine(966)-N(2))-methyltransferase RsmD [uncultured Veillonella sp.]|uniref:16S rRNA (guanine(966)-N(2))-methyltransferase RsmD n=1 Tax=uncultured Veillonella sp. TaxID=159268 RepID=UPI002616962E|nr:16S rRNA (guanine(966)-N(2))-methyltransferase RsmD [uncultured Veillonella sp.]
MRIIAGRAKGHNLKAPKGLQTRPTQDRVRESIFNVLSNYGINETTVLDLFSGTGAFALEAVSRGALRASCVDKATSRIIKDNIAHCHMEDAITVLPVTIQVAGNQLKGQQFDYIFSDPPYDRGFVAATFEVITVHQLLKNDGMLIMEHHEKELVELPKGWSIVKEQQFGYTRVTYCVPHEA